MNADAPSPAAAFIGRVNEFLTLQSHFRRRFNLAPAHWLTLHAALASVRFEQDHWICDEFSTTDVTRYSLTSRETIRRSLHWLLAKGLVIRQRRRYVVSPLALNEIRAILENTRSNDLLLTANLDEAPSDRSMPSASDEGRRVGP